MPALKASENRAGEREEEPAPEDTGFSGRNAGPARRLEREKRAGQRGGESSVESFFNRVEKSPDSCPGEREVVIATMNSSEEEEIEFEEDEKVRVVKENGVPAAVDEEEEEEDRMQS